MITEYNINVFLLNLLSNYSYDMKLSYVVFIENKDLKIAVLLISELSTDVKKNFDHGP